jgi:polyferredoxin
MGIDIRDGAQLECINCALCIDACDDIMGKVARPKGLIAYDSDLNMARRKAGLRPRFRIFRGRILLYSTAIVITGVLMLYGLTTRASIELNVIHDRIPPFVELADGGVRNAYTLKIINRAREERRFAVSVTGPAPLVLRAAGHDEEGTIWISVGGDEVRSLRLFATAGRGAFDSETTPIEITVREEQSGETAQSQSVFLKGGSQ